MDRKDETTRLDWSRLLGFDQVTRPDDPSELTLRDARLAKIGDKLAGSLPKLSDARMAKIGSKTAPAS